MASFCAFDHKPSPFTNDLTEDSVPTANHSVHNSIVTNKAIIPTVKYSFIEMVIFENFRCKNEMTIVSDRAKALFFIRIRRAISCKKLQPVL